MNLPTNLGVKPLGRGDEPSPVIQAEIQRNKAFNRALAAIVPVNTPEKSHQYRSIFATFHKDSVKMFREMRLTFDILPDILPN